MTDLAPMLTRRLAARLIPRPVKSALKATWEELGRRRLFGALAPLVPPVADMLDGPRSLQEFKRNGEEFLQIYKDVCGLRPDETMLDVGCGIGRKTLPLTQYFDARATYEGIDVARAGVDWCRDRITPRFPSFHFQHIDVYNRHYNPQGTLTPVQYRFPFAADSFSFVMLGSVFTHMLAEDLVSYLTEVRRVLSPGGRCLITYFLLNDESLRGIDAGASSLALVHPVERGRALSATVPEDAIGFDEGWITELYTRVGLQIMRVDYGSWSGRPIFLSYQDLILAARV